MVMNRRVVSGIFSFFCSAALFLTSSSTVIGSERVEKTLSLANCIEIALSNATSAKKADANLKLRGSDVLRRYGSFLPRLSVSAGYAPYTLSRTYTTGYPVAEVQKTTMKSADLTLSTSLNLFNGFSDYASRKHRSNRSVPQNIPFSEYSKVLCTMLPKPIFRYA